MTDEALKRPAQSLAMLRYWAKRRKQAKLATASQKRHAKRQADEPGHVLTCDPAMDVGLVE